MHWEKIVFVRYHQEHCKGTGIDEFVKDKRAVGPFYPEI
jgi:hypothetical protein